MRSTVCFPLVVALLLNAVLLLCVAPLAADGYCPALGGGVPLPRPKIPRGVAVDPPIDSREACPTYRWVAIKSRIDAPCPDPGPAKGADWEIRSLFETSHPGGLPPALRPFCLYKTESKRASVRAALNRKLEGLVRRGELRQVASSCAAVSPMTTQSSGSSALSPYGESARQWWSDSFLEQAGRWTWSTSRDVADPPRVHLAMLDTQPDGKHNAPGNSDHGFSLGRIARQLVCAGDDSSRCAATLGPRLALPISEFDWENPDDRTLNNEEGGYFGTVDHLATAIWAELEAWPEDKHLIINLSVAWVGERFGGLEDQVQDMPAPIQAVYEALQVANCRGALVLAAAGNRVGGPDTEDGPMLPGGWERRPAPTPQQCQALDVANSSELSRVDEPSVVEPLLYAVAGVRDDDRPLANARPGSEPPRVAYADHAVAGGLEAGSWTSILTGSSVATCVAAASAAVVWHHRPGLPRFAVIDILEDSGKALKRDADFHVDIVTPDVKRIKLCSALASACEKGQDHCPSKPIKCHEKISTDLNAAPLIQSIVLPATGEELNDPVHDFCESSWLYASGDISELDPCPFRQYYAIWARPWTGPQPQNDPCSGCAIRPPPPVAPRQSKPVSLQNSSVGDWQLWIEIDQDWPPNLLEQAQLAIGDVSFDLDLGDFGGALKKGDSVLVEGIDPTFLAADDDGRLPQAVLYFYTADGMTESPLFIFSSAAPAGLRSEDEAP